MEIISVRAPDGTKKKLQELAEKQDTTASELIRNSIFKLLQGEVDEKDVSQKLVELTDWKKIHENMVKKLSRKIGNERIQQDSLIADIIGHRQKIKELDEKIAELKKQLESRGKQRGHIGV
jgi:predicted transcriptional regulator